MSNLFLDAFNAVSGADFDEKPVTIEEFTTSEEYLGLPPLSDEQYMMIRAGSQIYRKDTLIALYGEEAGTKRYLQTCNEVIAAWGKGSGKDHCSTVVCAYIAYLLLCLRDPQKYYGKPSGDSIVIMNVAINAQQASRVFFRGLSNLIKNSPWFADKATVKSNEIEFDKSISVVSGHSESESLEGYNVIAVVLDEISGFALESNTGNRKAITAQSTYDMHRASVDSRFPKEGKVILLSFPRFEGDFITQRYNEVVAEKEVITRSHTFKIDEDLPDGTEGNEFTIEWDEEIILKYKPAYPRTYATKKPTWEVNPLRTIDDFKNAFLTNPEDALGRFAAQPGAGLEGGFFKNHAAIDTAASLTNGVDEHGIFYEGLTPKDGVDYYMHVDLAQVHDKCAVGMAHVEKWVDISIGADYHELHPFVVVDALRWWKPDKTLGIEVEFSDVRDYIIAMRRRGFNIRLVTFDRWSSLESRNILEREHGIKTDVLSVDNSHYEDFRSTLYDGRCLLPNEPLLKDELKGLIIDKKGKVDHPRSGGKDLSDGVCGAIYNAVQRTPKPQNQEVEVLSYKDIQKKMLAEQQQKKPLGVISMPKKEVPEELADYMSRFKLL